MRYTILMLRLVAFEALAILEIYWMKIWLQVGLIKTREACNAIASYRRGVARSSSV